MSHKMFEDSGIRALQILDVRTKFKPGRYDILNTVGRDLSGQVMSKVSKSEE